MVVQQSRYSQEHSPARTWRHLSMETPHSSPRRSMTQRVKAMGRPRRGPIMVIPFFFGGIMHWIVLAVSLVFTSPAFADGGHDHHTVPTLKNQTTTVVTVKDNAVTLTFGPVDLPSGHDGDLAASMPKHVFQLPKDMYLVGYKSAVFTKDGKPLPKNYLHHILMLNNSKPSVSCEGEPLFFARAGLEMTETRFPEGYGVKLAKGDHLMSIVAFYHKAPITKDVIATFTMYMAPEGTPIKELDVYQVGVNIVCFSKFSHRGPDQTDEGIEITTGVQIHKAPLKFRMDGCVKFAYPHGHDELLMIGLDNTTKRQTLLRTVPDVDQDGTFLEFRPHQVYQDRQGFPVTK